MLISQIPIEEEVNCDARYSKVRPTTRLHSYGAYDMIAIRPQEAATLRSRGYVLMLGSDMLTLMDTMMHASGPLLLIEVREPVLTRHGYELETKSYGYAALHDGVLLSYIGFSLARRHSLLRLGDERTRKWVLRTVVDALDQGSTG